MEEEEPEGGFIDIIDTALDPWITQNDSLNRHLLTRKGFGIEFHNPRLVSRKRGMKLYYGSETWYMYVIRVKDFTINGVEVEGPKQVNIKEVPLGPTRQEMLSRAQQQNAAENDSTQADSLGGGEDKKKGCKFFRNLFGGKKNGKKRRNRQSQTDTTVSDSAAQAQIDQNFSGEGGDVNVSSEPERRVRRERSEEDMYMYFAVVSKRKKIKTRRPGDFYSRCLFVKGIVDRTDSIKAFKKIIEQGEARLDSLKEQWKKQGEFFHEWQAEFTDSVRRKLEWDMYRYELYRDLKGNERGRGILNFFLTEHFYSTNLKWNIIPRPFGLPKMVYLKDTVEQDTSKPPRLIDYRFGINPQRRKQKRKRPKIEETDELQQAPWAGEEEEQPDTPPAGTPAGTDPNATEPEEQRQQ